MLHKYLVVAIILASTFGAALLSLGMYLLNRYLSIRWNEPDYWYKGVAWSRWNSHCKHCRGNGCCRDEEKGRRRCRSRRRERSNWSRRRWYGHGHMQRPGAALGVLPVSRRVSFEGVYTPRAEWSGQVYNDGRMAATQPAVGSSMYPQGVQQQALPSRPPLLQQQLPYQPAVPEPRTIPNPFPRREHDALARELPRSYSGDSQSKIKPEGSKPRLRKVDYIHIVDEYPPIVQDAINKIKPRTKTRNRHPAATVTSMGSMSTESVEEVPRESVPQGASPPAFVGPDPIGVFQNVHIETQTWDARIS